MSAEVAKYLPSLLLLLLTSYPFLRNTVAHDAHVCHVQPKSSCLGDPKNCCTIDDYAVSSACAIPLCVRMLFVVGEHYLHHHILISNISNITLEANISDESVHVLCEEGSFSFLNVEAVEVFDLFLIGCGLHADNSTSLSFSNVTNVTVLNVSISNGGGIGLFNVLGYSNISGCQFYNASYSASKMEDIGVLSVWYYDYLDRDNTVPRMLMVEYCNFNKSGLSPVYLFLNQNLYPVIIELAHIRFIDTVRNSRYLSSDFNLMLQSDASNRIVIRDSHFQSKYGDTSVAAVGMHSAVYIYVTNLESVNASQSTAIEIQDTIISDLNNTMAIIATFTGSGSYAACRMTVKNVVISNIHLDSIATSAHTASVALIRYSYNKLTQYNILFQNVSFINNTHESLSSRQLTVLLSSAHNVTFVDCNFEGNIGTAIAAFGSKFTLSGSCTFLGNSAYKGGALSFYEQSSFTILENSPILFQNNHADDVGGVIFVHNGATVSHFLDSHLCFLQLALTGDWHYNLSNAGISLTFVNNSAENGGDVVYGGGTTSCKVSAINNTLYSEEFLSKFTNINKTGHSTFASDPYRVYICRSGTESHCGLVEPRHDLYSGQTISISAAVVGDVFGRVRGAVYAQLLSKSHHLQELPDPFSQPLEKIQEVSAKSCTLLNYTLVSQTSSCEHLILTTSPVKIAIVPDFSDLKDEVNITDVIPFYLATCPVYIEVCFHPCPLGFEIDNSSGICQCSQSLSNLGLNIYCSIADKTITTENNIWIGTLSNEGDEHYAVSKECYYSYCNRQKKRTFNISNPDIQCAFNRSGVLCGSCSEGLSMTIGGNSCRKCSNHYLALIIAFAVMGICLVVGITFFNFTVTVGTLNGLIFYASIVQANRSLFLYNDTNNSPNILLDLFLSWICLDFGIETCLYDGFDAYVKVWLRFAFPLYLLGIILLIYITAKLKYSRTLFNCMAEISSNCVPVLATLIMLSFSKFINIIVSVFSGALLTVINKNGSISTKVVWQQDGSIDYFEGKHIPLVVISFIMLFLWAPFLLVILFIQLCQKMDHLKPLRWIAKWMPFWEAYTAPLKDQHRYWVGIHLLVRTLFMSILTVSKPDVHLLSLGILLILLMAYSAGVHSIYKRWYNNVLENSYFANLAILSLGTLYARHNHFHRTVFSCTMVFIALLQFFVTFIVHAYIRLREVYHICCGSQSRHTVLTKDDPSLAKDLESTNTNSRSSLVDTTVNYESSHSRLPSFHDSMFCEYREPVLKYLDTDSVLKD